MTPDEQAKAVDEAIDFGINADIARWKLSEAIRQRNERIRALRNADPKRWTYQLLADVIGCSPELIARIVKPRNP